MSKRRQARSTTNSSEWNKHEQELIRKYGPSMEKELRRMKAVKLPKNFGKAGRPDFLDRKPTGSQ